MKRASIHLLIMLLATAPAFALDTIVFKNGDTLTGTILKQDAEHVHFKSGSFGSVSLNTPDIAEIRIETQELGKITVPSEAIINPEPASPAPIAVVAAQAAQTSPSPPPNANPPKKMQWSGQAGLAIAMREKNTIQTSNGNIVSGNEKYDTYRVYGNVNWKGGKNDLKWDWTYRYSEDETTKRDDYLNITQKYNHNFKGSYYTEAKTVYQSDYNRNIDNEYLQTAELGIKWFDRPPKFQFSTSIGGGYHQYDRTVSGEEISTGEPKFIFDESLQWQLINSLTLFQKYTHLGDLEKYHFVFTSGLENKLIRDVFLRLEYRLDRDTDTSYDGQGYYDKALLTSLLYKF